MTMIDDMSLKHEPLEIHKVRDCLGFCAADLCPSLAYESAVQKTQIFPNIGFLTGSGLLDPRTSVLYDAAPLQATPCNLLMGPLSRITITVLYE